MPYLSANFSEFWRRWHISLSSWLRDYLFIPLGGSRRGRWRTARNLLITMTLGGLWHGASWTFVVWGILHGLLLILHRAFQSFADARPRLGWLLHTVPGTAVRVLVTFLAVSLCWVFFRAQSFGDALSIFEGLARKAGEGPPMSRWNVAVTALILLACYAVGRRNLWLRVADRLPAPVLGAGYALLAALCLLLAPMSEKAFIYFQF
jgi:alginate O-acetyltransferase complex protein AlgI